ncbi:HvfA family oxazolone/thioamide-modified RiPP metallophore [Thiohalobacter sp.]|uniref:HvfA family oxazolone/thioamide-modified RiPP metallophore n=1 Tax=Thiohalobacter sp. TaxID=2025948 RepID=UPI002621059A|nr:hypothetical protein [Thiohalobacter sp.]
MSNQSTRKPLAVALGAAFATSLSTGAIAADNPFSSTELSGGYMTAEMEGKCGSMNKAGKPAAKMQDRMKEGKCGEGKCGGMNKADKPAAKMKEGKCGEGKCGGMTKAEKATSKMKEGKCGGMKQ